MKDKFLNWIAKTPIWLISLYIIIFFVAMAIPIINVRYAWGCEHNMENTYQADDRLIAIRTDNIQAGDIVLVEVNGKYIPKRIIGVPGDTVLAESNGCVTVNDEVLVEDYTYFDKNRQPYELTRQITLKEDEYYVMGDNRNWSIDSRHYGAVTSDEIFGKVIFKL